VAHRLEARDLEKRLGDRVVIDRVSLALGDGEIVTLEGPSGSGKSTLLRMLATLTPADRGTLSVDGALASSMPPSAYRAKVSFVLQESPMFEGTVADNVATGPRLRGRSPSAESLDAVLARVGLGGFGPRVARDLSGGERQRVAVARAIANEPRVLLLDEPTSALDPASAERLLEVVRALASEGLAVVVVTHVADHARALGGRRLSLERGKLVPLGDGPSA
jgi:ABC-type multidrug transport system ATPase subunit